jgi:SAM-dependent methyltransferase
MTRRPLGAITRGTTNPNRLRRVDAFIAATYGLVLRTAGEPLVVDLGFGATPTTTVEMRDRLARLRPDVRVVGVEIDPDRVAAAAAASAEGLEFVRGGFELAGLRPVIVRALNVLRQYDEDEVRAAWSTMAAQLAPDGVLIEGTCDELGRLGTWLAIPATGTPVSLTLSANLTTLETPAAFAERLPKALIHHNVTGSHIFDFLRDLHDAWIKAAAYSAFGPRQRFERAVAATRTAGWPIWPQPRRWRRGEVTVPWATVG